MAERTAASSDDLKVEHSAAKTVYEKAVQWVVKSVDLRVENLADPRGERTADLSDY